MRTTLPRFLVIAPVLGAGRADAQTVLDVPLHGQQTGTWSYATTTQMIGEYFGSTIKQCTISSWDNGGLDCCSGPTRCLDGGDTYATLSTGFGRAGTPLGSITLHNAGGRWVMMRAGSPNLTRALVAVRAALPSDVEEVGLVRSAELGVDFLAVCAGDELSLVPLYDNGELQLRAGTMQPAVAVMAQLAPAARSRNTR